MICVGISVHSDLMEPHERLQIARSARKMTVPALSAALKIAESSVRAHLNGQNGLRPQVAAEYARALKVSAEWRLYGTGAMESTSEPDASMMLPIAGDIEAGGVTLILDRTEGQEPIELIRFSLNKQQLGFRVRGNSMEPRFRENEMLIFGPEVSPYEAVGQEVVTQLKDGRRLAKILRRGSSKGLWSLYSYNALYPPIEDVELDWVRKFEGMLR